MITDTIIAQVTPQGSSGVAILRISGKQTYKVCLKILKKIPKPRYADYLDFFGNNDTVLDKGIAIWFPGPYSFTGDDTLELQGHGNPVIIDLLLKNILTIDKTRIAHPGEFSKRAFLNNKIDLIQAESIMDLIHASSERSVHSSLRSMEGRFSLHIQQLLKKITDIRTMIEAFIDFEENDNTIIVKKLELQLDRLIYNLQKIKIISKQGNILREGFKITIVGPTNSGKSSFLNALSLRDSAIVTNIAGTTRDILREWINIKGVTFCFSDTAGLRSTTDEIELIGIKKTYHEIYHADHLLLVIDSSLSKFEQNQIYLNFLKTLSQNIPLTVILNKSDLIGNKTGIYTINKVDYIFLSSLKNIGFDIFYDYLEKKLLWRSKNCSCDDNQSIFISRRRHLDSLEKCLFQLIEGKKNWKKYRIIELLAENLNLAHIELSKITGKFSSEDLLENIFSKFCIGK